MRFTVETDGQTAVHDVTDRVAEALPEEADGVATIFSRHTTAGVAVNEPEDGLFSDVEEFLEELVPSDDWDHGRIDDNSVARSATGSAV